MKKLNLLIGLFFISTIGFSQTDYLLTPLGDGTASIIASEGPGSFRIIETYNDTLRTHNNTDTMSWRKGKSAYWLNTTIPSIVGYDANGLQNAYNLSALPIATILGYTPYNGSTNPNSYISTSTASSTYQTLANLQNHLTPSSVKYPSVDAVIGGLNIKQDALVSGTNVKTINSQSILGSGNLAIAGAVTSASNTPEAVASGTIYSLTTSSAKVDFGTTDPAVTIPEAGTYLIYVNIKIDFAGLTTVLQTCNFKLRRTNNTATDLTGAITNVNIPAATLLTGTGPDTDMRVIKYTTTNSNDVIELWGNRQGVTIGNINVSEASVLAVRIY